MHRLRVEFAREFEDFLARSGTRARLMLSFMIWLVALAAPLLIGKMGPLGALAHQDRLFTIAWRTGGDRHEAEDLVQDCFVRAYRALSSYPPARIRDLRLRGWLTTILLGIVGGVVGGFLGNLFFGVGIGHFFSIRTWVLAFVGSIIVLAIWGAVKGRTSTRA